MHRREKNVYVFLVKVVYMERNEYVLNRKINQINNLMDHRHLSPNVLSLHY